MAWAQWIVLALQVIGLVAGVVRIITGRTQDERVQRFGGLVFVALATVCLYFAGAFSHIF